MHALIFLFRYRTQDEQDQYSGSSQDHIWFANQVPDFACATVATLNIVNNIPGLQMGKELRDFRQATRDMKPISRGEAIDDFAFVKRIHNSFARENDLLTADLHAKEKIAKQKKKAATAKALATKAANKAERDAKEEALNGSATSTRAASTRRRVPTAKASQTPSDRENKTSSKAVQSADRSPDLEDDREFKLSGKGKPRKKLISLKGPRKPDDAVKVESGEDEETPRRSGRARKAPNRGAYVSAADEETDQAGFHFIAYMPIKDHVWKMDGLDYHPIDMGTFGEGGNGADGGTGNWMHVVAPALQNRMEAAQEQGEISFTLLAVVHDPVVDDRRDLAKNIKTLRLVDNKLGLSKKSGTWHDSAYPKGSKDVLYGPSNEYDIFSIDISNATLPMDVVESIKRESSTELNKRRESIIQRQAQIRSSIRSAKMEEEQDEEKARHRRHLYYGTFIRKWMTALAEEEVLESLVG